MAKKILLADDSPTIRKVVELTFADEGIEVYAVPDGDAAMVKFVQIEPDIVIADVNMPGMSGYRLCEMIKQDETTHHIPVILLVGSFEPFDPGEASRVGSNYYFTKPFRSIRELVEKVHECLETGGVATADEIADIENLYADSIETSDESAGPEDDAAAFAAPSEIEEAPRLDESHDFDDGATLDEILLETPSGGLRRTESQDTDPRETVAEVYDRAAGEYAGLDHGYEQRPIADAGESHPGIERVNTGELDIHRTFEEAEPEFAAGDVAEDADRVDLELSTPNESDAAAIDRYELAFDLDDSRSQSDVEAVTAPAADTEDHALAAASVAASAGDNLAVTASSSPWEEPVAETQAAAVPVHHNASELGDAGMDDEIIETVHPNGTAEIVDEPEPEPVTELEPLSRSIDPFHERVAHTEPAAGDEGAGEASSVVMPFPGSEGRHDEPRHELPATELPQDEAGSPKLAAHVTPELIESIVASVLEKMSDRAVRDAAQEAVPRIAEKLIREALVDDKKD